MLTDYFPPHTGGGVEQVVSRLVDGLLLRDHTIAVQTLRTCSAPSSEKKGALSIYRAPAVDLTFRLGVQQTLSLTLLAATDRLIRTFKPDVVHAHNLFFRTTEVAAFLRMLYDIPLVTTLHLGKAEGDGSALNFMVRLYESTAGRLILQRSDCLIAVSRAVAEHVRDIVNDSQEVRVIPNGVDTGLFYPHNNGRKEQVVLFVGRLVPNKGPEALIRAVPEVLRRHPQAQFLMVGEGPLRNRLQNLAYSSGISRNIKFPGVRHDIPQIMRDAALFVRPSTLEGMPLTVLEAMASGLPVVATPVGGTPEIVSDGINGYLVPVGDSAALAGTINKLLDSPSLAETMGSRGRERAVAGYSWDSVVEKTERAYVEISHKSRVKGQRLKVKSNNWER